MLLTSDDAEQIAATAMGLPETWCVCELRYPPGQLAIMSSRDRRLADARWIGDPAARMIRGSGRFRPHTYVPPHP